MQVPRIADDKLVRHFRQILLWPLQLMPIREDSQIQNHWELLETGGADNPWREVADEFAEPGGFQERHYNELVTFLPYVQRFLYGEGRARVAGPETGASPMRVFRRNDVAAVRITSQAGESPLTLKVAHVDLYFFYDIDVVLLKVEVHTENLSLYQAQDMLYRFGRAYPAGWDEHGRGLHCMERVEWLGAEGDVLAQSDAERRDEFLSFVCRHRAPRISSHWAYLLQPLILDHSTEQGVIRYRQLEYYRMPVMAYLAVENPRALSRSDLIRLGWVAMPGTDESLPYSDRHVADFEQRYCYDRFWTDSVEGPASRYMCCGHALVVVGEGRSPYFINPETGVLAQFRHQHFLLFLIAHLQKASLLMFSDRLVDALNKLVVHNPESVKRFKRAIRQHFEIFLRFTHRYWFHQIADHAQTKALFHLCAQHLGTDKLYQDVKERIHDMNAYLDSDSLRRQANTVVRLTVVTTFGLIGTVVTGFLGMNLLAEADSPFAQKVLYFALVLIPVTLLTLYTILRSKRLSDFLEALSDERLPARSKIDSLMDVWRKKRKFGE